MEKTARSCSSLLLIVVMLLLLHIGEGLVGGCRPSPCRRRDIVVVQAAGPPEFSGIPSFMVEIHNLGHAPIAQIHLHCGWFSSANLINPKVFKRLRFDDCLVNDGKPLPPGSSLSFKYTTSFKHPLSVSSVKCACVRP